MTRSFRIKPRAMSLAVVLASVLGACTTVQPVAEPAPQQAAPVSQSRIERLVPAALKNAETAMVSYHHARKDEDAARAAAVAAGNAALVARHRYTTGTTDYLTLSAAKRNLSVAEDNLKAASAGASAARGNLYRAFGLSAFAATPVNEAAPATQPDASRQM